MDPDGISTVLEDAPSPTAPVRRYDEDNDDDGLAGDYSGTRDVGGVHLDFYPYRCTPAMKDDDDRTTTVFTSAWDRHTPERWGIRTCLVCGQRATTGGGGKDEEERRGRFCSTRHAKEYHRRWTTTRSSMDGDGEGDTDGVGTPSFFDDVYSRSVLVVEDELSVPPSTHDDDGAVDTDCNENDDDNDDTRVTQSNLNRWTMMGCVGGGMSDTTTVEFFTCVRRDDGSVKEQCLRYQRWPFPPSTAAANDALKRSNVKLQAQQVTAFKGNSIQWHPWKKKTRAAIGTAGMLRILDDPEYARRHPVDNETVFHLLSISTSDRSASHLVDKFEETRDGRAAYRALVSWYKGDKLTTETAEDVQDKLDKTVLFTDSMASEYINNFQLYVKQLDDLGESYTPSKTISMFLSQISDPDYTATAELCILDKLHLEDCIQRIRGKERRLARERVEKRRGGLQVRKTRHFDYQKDEMINLDNYRTDKGFYSVPSNIWTKLTKQDRELIKRENGKIRKQRE